MRTDCLVVAEINADPARPFVMWPFPTTQKLVAARWLPVDVFTGLLWPTLNPIEHLKAALKPRLRKDLATAANPFFLTANMSHCSRQLP